MNNLYENIESYEIMLLLLIALIIIKKNCQNYSNKQIYK